MAFILGFLLFVCFKKEKLLASCYPPMLCLCITGAEADLKGSYSTERVHPSLQAWLSCGSGEPSLDQVCLPRNNYFNGLDVISKPKESKC